MHCLSRTAILRADVVRIAVRASSTINWGHTLNLPKSGFPARATSAELSKYRERCADDLYQWQRENRPRSAEQQFILHDGPPYANGPVHAGHALNKIVKDMILRWELARGKRIHYRPGWDCHGLPIELKALQEVPTFEDSPPSSADGSAVSIDTSTMSNPSDRLSAEEIRKRARRLASRTIKTQMASFKSWAVMGEWDEPYKTMDRDFEIRQLGVFKQMVQKGLISRHYRPVYWSPSSGTALAEAELEYDDAHVCTAAFVKLPFVELPDILSENPNIRRAEISALIWTTTPWTLPANKAIAVKDDIEYTVIDLLDETGISTHGQLIVAKDRLEHLVKQIEGIVRIETVVDTIIGAELAKGNPKCFNAFQGTSSPIVTADFVTATSGTGLVHMAPGHGMEDYQVCQRLNIGPAFAPVNDRGRYTSEVSTSDTRTQLEGLDVQTDGAAKVLELLARPISDVPSSIWAHASPLLFASHKFTHKNPIDWRTKQPVIVRATAQWFADISAIKDRALESLDHVKFIPSGGKERLSSFVSGRSQWCISRQRAWGVPIPALFNTRTQEACISPESVDHIISVIEQRGIDTWFSDAQDDPAWVHNSLGAGPWIRGRDTMDVWFDSGTTWTLLDRRENQPVSDIYFEGTDQHRGWFQSSLLTAVSVQDASSVAVAPYATLVTHGFTLDAQGRKMSKSIGNVISPDEIVAGSLLPPLKAKKQKGQIKSKLSASQTAQAKVQYDSMGPDALRLWVASSDYTRDVVVAVPVLQEVQQALQKWRVTFKFLLGVLGDSPHTSTRPALPDVKLTFADHIILKHLATISAKVREAFEAYQFHKAVKEINTLVNTYLSSFYFEICKDRIYTDSESVRQNTQAVLTVIYHELNQMLLPIVPHLIEEVWQHAPEHVRGEYPFHKVWDKPYSSDTPKLYNDVEFSTLEEMMWALRDHAQKAQEKARAAGHLKSGLACDAILRSYGETKEAPHSEPLLAKVLHETDDLAELLGVSQVTITQVPQAERGLPRKHAWSYEVSLDSLTQDAGDLIIVPPSKHKCVRCWRYVAENSEKPCTRCKTVLKEKGMTDLSI